ncbi:MAG: Unknown protein [uncultured Sulfurovum sp.]|uniref:Uncharacterized protein n=1 Tax=uncultured Sulfurovum sp. TaxID=269237 RepID=A0A6S6U1M3_9BACT|nr:MAG: Unknown protein [uncultured Sulfurovum sp.]
MTIKIIENNKKTIKLEIVIDLESENFLETEERIMDKVNEIGQTLTKEALKKLDIKETVLSINEQNHYAKEVKKNIRPLMEK